MTLDPKKRTQILQSIKKRVLAHHINVGGIDYGAWTERVDATALDSSWITPVTSPVVVVCE